MHADKQDWKITEAKFWSLHNVFRTRGLNPRGLRKM